MNKPTPTVERDRGAYLGMDIGGTKIAAGVVTFPDAHIHARRTIPTQPARGGEAVLADVRLLADELSKEACANQLRVEHIGLGICELVDRNGNVASANCLNWLDLPVREHLSEIALVVLEADVRAAALGEARFGAGKPFRIFLYVTVGTGISCSLVLDGQPFLGALGATGTMASSPIPCPPELAGSRMPTIEEIAAGPALAACVRNHGGSTQTAEEVLAAAHVGNARAMTVVRSAAEALGAGLGGLVNVLDPEAIVIGGGLGLSQGLFHDTLVDSVRRHIWSNLHRGLPILRAGLGVDAGLIGAAAVAWSRSGVGTGLKDGS